MFNSRLMIDGLREYLNNPEHRKEFEAWYEKTYGKKYDWRINNEHLSGLHS